MVDQQKEHTEKTGSEPIFVLSNRILFQTPIKNILVERITVCKDFSIKKLLNSCIIHLIIFIASGRHLVAVLQDI